MTSLREHVHDPRRRDRPGQAAQQPEVAERTEAALRRFAGVLLHRPSVRARELAGDGRHDDYLAALEALFGITHSA
ncbi:MAG: hypothetical protein IPL43_14965 [Micropruina sp.]|nr:hypothetical protein [Micropruina sp.]